jgi:hypothetical protein
MGRLDSEPDVVKTIELHSLAARFIGFMAIWAFFGFVALIIVADSDAGPGAGVFATAVAGFAAILLAFAILCEPYRALITTNGKIRFDSVMSRKEYDLEKIRSLKVVEDSEGSREIRLEFSDGKYRMLAPVNHFHELAAAIKEVQPSVKIEHLPPNWFERMIGRTE